jgi:hypothetical protein
MRAPYLYASGRTRQKGYFGSGVKVYRAPAVKTGAIPMVVFGPPAKAIEGFFCAALSRCADADESLFPSSRKAGDNRQHVFDFDQGFRIDCGNG